MSSRDDWTETTLGDVAEASWGNTAVTKKQYTESGFTAFSASGPDGYVDWFEHDEKGVVLSAIGALCGKTWLADGKWTPIKNTIWIKSRSKNCLTDYLFLVSKTPDLWPIRGQAQPFISLGDVRLVDISLPPLDDQKRIVDLVSSVNSYIESLQSQVDTARTARNAMLHELLSASGDDWTETTLGELSSITYGFTESARSEIVGPKFLRITDIQNGKVDWSSVPYCPINEKDLQKQILMDGDIVFARTGATTGKSLLIIQPPEAVCASYLIRLRPNHLKVNPHFLNFNFQTDAYWQQIRSGSSGSAQGGFNASKLGDLRVSIPGKDEQMRIVEIISTMDEVIIATEQAVVDAKNLRSGLLSDLLTGEHEIPSSYDNLMGDS